MDEALELEEYLPLSYKSTSEQEYIKFLWDAFETNYTHGKYQFAFLAYHMLTMSFVYFNIWQIKQYKREDFLKATIGFTSRDLEGLLHKDDDHQYKKWLVSPFNFSKVQERSILRIFTLIGCDKAKIKRYVKLVDDRNDTAHSNGSVLYGSQAVLDTKITEVMRVVAEIQTHSKPVIENCFREFLLDNHDPENREYPDDLDQIREVLVHTNYLSQKDVEICLGFDISVFDDHAAADPIRELFNSFQEAYRTDAED